MKGTSADLKPWSGRGKRFRGCRLVHEASAGQPTMWVPYGASWLGLFGLQQRYSTVLNRPFHQCSAISWRTGQPCAWHIIADSFAKKRRDARNLQIAPPRQGGKRSFHDQQCSEMTGHRVSRAEAVDSCWDWITDLSERWRHQPRFRGNSAFRACGHGISSVIPPTASLCCKRLILCLASVWRVLKNATGRSWRKAIARQIGVVRCAAPGRGLKMMRA
jgi:hypothetical protein